MPRQQLRSLRDCHDESSRLRVGNGDRAIPRNLFLEDWDNASVAAQDVAEAHWDKFGRAILERAKHQLAMRVLTPIALVGCTALFVDLNTKSQARFSSAASATLNVLSHFYQSLRRSWQPSSERASTPPRGPAPTVDHARMPQPDAFGC
jgi:hypothetical protein